MPLSQPERLQDGTPPAGSAPPSPPSASRTPAQTSAAVCKLRIRLDCDELLKPHLPGSDLFIAKTASEAADELNLADILNVRLLQEVKIKLFHVCGKMKQAGERTESCLDTLWALNEWFRERYWEVSRKVANGDGWVNNHGIRYLDMPDATLTIFID